jgi:hypothetical protein
MSQGELSISDLFIHAKNGILFLKKKKIIIFSAASITGILGLLWNIYFHKPKYKSIITFTLEQKSGVSASALSGLANSLGIGDLSGGSQSGMFGGENILYLLRSNRIIHQSLKETQDELNGDNLLNCYLKNHFPQQIKRNQISLFPMKIDLISFSRKQDSILLSVSKQIIEEQIVAERQDNKTSIIKLQVIDQDEKWAYLFSKSLMKNAINLYLEIKIGKLLRTEGELIQKKDSIRELLDGSISTLAYETDMSSHIPLMRHKTKQVKKQIDVEVNKNIYSNIIQNLEITRFQRSQQEPIIEIIDSPILPLESSRISKLITLVFSSLIGAIIITVFLLIKNVINRYKILN